jgi:hypothetical protein
MPVALFSSSAEAEPVRKRLADNGIPAEIHDKFRIEKLWYVSNPGVVRLEVPAEQFERGYKMLIDWDAAEGCLRGAIRCPECKSLRIEYPQASHKSILPNLVVGFMAAVGHVNHEFYCHECHFNWHLQTGAEPPLRPHMAPNYFIEDVEGTSTPPPEKPGG